MSATEAGHRGGVEPDQRGTAGLLGVVGVLLGPREPHPAAQRRASGRTRPRCSAPSAAAPGRPPGTPCPLAGSTPDSRRWMPRTRAPARSASRVVPNAVTRDVVGRADQPAPRVGAEVAVGEDPVHRDRVDRLQQQRPQPGERHRGVGVHPPGHAGGPVQAGVGVLLQLGGHRPHASHPGRRPARRARVGATPGGARELVRRHQRPDRARGRRRHARGALRRPAGVGRRGARLRALRAAAPARGHRRLPRLHPLAQQGRLRRLARVAGVRPGPRAGQRPPRGRPPGRDRQHDLGVRGGPAVGRRPPGQPAPEPLAPAPGRDHSRHGTPPVGARGDDDERRLRGRDRPPAAGVEPR